MDEMQEVIDEFLVESQENLDQLDQDLLALEDDPGSTASLSSVFRTIHTIKGTCGFLGFSTLESVAHVGENLLAKLRDGALVLTPEMTSVLLRLSDAVREMLLSIEQTGSDGGNDYAELVAALGGFLEAPASEPVPAPAEPPDEGVAEPSGTSPLATPPEGSPEPAEAATPVAPPPVPRAQTEAPPTVAATVAASAPARAESTIRVDVGVLDELMTRVGELVLARNRLVQLVAGGDGDPLLAATVQHLSLITSELQEGAMKTRMQPIGNLWSKYPRIVRDIAVTCGKEVRVEMEGEDTELDKTIIESIKDPLTHLIRNAVDHGIETPDERRLTGKTAEGRLLVRAFHEGGQVNIEIRDDGGGIDPDRLRAKAVERGIVTEAAAVALSDAEVIDLIFAPGFSTAAAVTNVSGRGVGMDVVRTDVERIGGAVHVTSLVGEGTTFRVKIPLTLAIIPGLVVTSGENRYCIPQVNLLELVRLVDRHGRSGVEHVHGAPVYRLRGRLLPLVYLHEELGDPAPEHEATQLVVLQADGRQFGLVVDEVKDSVEIVVKPLGAQVKSIPVFAGATIMGDGKVGLILDVLGLAQRSGVLTDKGERGVVPTPDAGGQVEDRQTTLLFETADDGRMAVPLSLVDRLEEIDISSIEHAGLREVVQYRGEILPLLRVSGALPERRRVARNDGPASEEASATQVEMVVHHTGERNVGVVVGTVLDVVEIPLALSPSSREGVLGTVVIDGRVTEVLDLPTVVRMAEAASGRTAAA